MDSIGQPSWNRIHNRATLCHKICTFGGLLLQIVAILGVSACSPQPSYDFKVGSDANLEDNGILQSHLSFDNTDDPHSVRSLRADIIRSSL